MELQIIEPGIGGDLCPGTSVSYHYSCYSEYGDEPIDSTHFRKKMSKTKLGQGDVLPGNEYRGAFYMFFPFIKIIIVPLLMVTLNCMCSTS